MIEWMATAPLSLSSAKKLHPFQTDDPRLRPIHDKVMAQERLSADDALALYRSGDILAVGWLANHVRERMHGDTRLLQRQSPHQLHQRLRGGVPPVRLRPQEGRARRLHHGAGRGLEHRRFRLHRSHHGVSHCRRPACRSAVPVLRRSDRRIERALSRRCTSKRSPWSRSRSSPRSAR